MNFDFNRLSKLAEEKEFKIERVKDCLIGLAYAARNDVREKTGAFGLNVDTTTPAIDVDNINCTVLNEFGLNTSVCVEYVTVFNFSESRKLEVKMKVTSVVSEFYKNSRIVVYIDENEFRHSFDDNIYSAVAENICNYVVGVLVV
ncbi:TPA: hypothetical protein PEP05_000785 [Vibrio parahaemolyticus]|nr:hypothetical protein [Vibrio parahaemolyticus]